MKRFFLIYLLPAGLINLGNVFAFLFQLTIIRSLPVADVGAFNAIFALINVIAAPAAVLPLGIARTMITTTHTEGAAGHIVSQSALWGLAISVAAIAAGALLIEPLRDLLEIAQPVTAMLALLLLCSILLSSIAIGWLQGSLRYISSSLAMASIPGLRLVFGLWLVVLWSGGINAAVAATAIPGLVVFTAGVISFRSVAHGGRASFPQETWRDFWRFMVSSSASSFLLLGFWNLDVVTVRSIFSPEESGLYAVAALLGRIPFLLSIAVTSMLFSETTRSALDRSSSESAPRRVLAQNFALATALGLLAATLISLFAERILVMFAGPVYAASTPMLQVLSFAMALLALLQVLVTYMLARNQHRVLFLLAAGLIGFLSLAGLHADSPLDVVHYLDGAVGTLIVACLLLIFLKPVTAPGNVTLTTRGQDETAL